VKCKYYRRKYILLGSIIEIITIFHQINEKRLNLKSGGEKENIHIVVKNSSNQVFTLFQMQSKNKI
jgi:hypothetical protein